MNKLYIIIFSVLPSVFAANIYVHSSLLYKKVPYSDQYITQGSLIRNVDFIAANNVKVQIENALGIKLQDRNEAHITVITPPEFNGDEKNKIAIGNAMRISTIHNLFKTRGLQDLPFGIHDCIGEMQERDEEGKITKRVFYLIIRAPYLFSFRKEVFDMYAYEAKRRNIPYRFDPYQYFPHITLGFVGGDIHRPGKDQTSCTKEDLSLILL